MKKVAINLLASVFVILLLHSCSDDNPTSNDDDNPTQTNYTLITRVASTATSSNFYAQNVKDLSEQKTYDNSKATEILSSNQAGITSFGGSLYLNGFASKMEIVKWKPNSDGVYKKEGTMNVEELGSSANICFKDKNTAFVGGSSSSKILIFNPSTMKKTGYIDFSSISKKGTVTNFPENGDKVNFEVPTEMIINGNYMYVNFMYFKKLGSISASKNVNFLIIDLSKVNSNDASNTGAIVKWIKDTRGAVSGSYNSGHGARFIIKDESGDIYILCHNTFGSQRQATKKPACVLRIKNGQTDFDPDYYFDLETASRGLGNPVVNLEYVGNGDFYAASMDPSKLDPSNPWSFYLDPTFQWYKFNLKTKTAKKVSEEYTNGNNTAITYHENGKVYIPIEQKTKSFILEVDNSTLKSKKTLTTAGAPVILKLK